MRPLLHHSNDEMTKLCAHCPNSNYWLQKVFGQIQEPYLHIDYNRQNQQEKLLLWELLIDYRPTSVTTKHWSDLIAHHWQ